MRLGAAPTEQRLRMPMTKAGPDTNAFKLTEATSLQFSGRQLLPLGLLKKRDIAGKLLQQVAASAGCLYPR